MILSNAFNRSNKRDYKLLCAPISELPSNISTMIVLLLRSEALIEINILRAYVLSSFLCTAVANLTLSPLHQCQFHSLVHKLVHRLRTSATTRICFQLKTNAILSPLKEASYSIAAPTSPGNQVSSCFGGKSPKI